MSPIPSDVPTWCTAPDNNPTPDIVEPGAGTRSDGWNAGGKITAQNLNWYQNLVGQWIVVFRAMLTKTLEERSAQVKSPVDGDVWLALAVGVGSQLNRQVVVGVHITDWGPPIVYGDPIVFWRLANGRWTVASSYSGTGARYLDVASGAGLFVGITLAGHSESSPTGATWTDDGAMLGGGGIVPRAIHFDGSDFVAAGEAGAIAASSDGQSWGSVLNVGGAHFRDVFGAAGLWVAVGESGRCYTASDAYGTWTSRTSQFGADNCRAVVYDPVHALWCIVGENGKVSTSPDGATWTPGRGRRPGHRGSRERGDGRTRHAPRGVGHGSRVRVLPWWRDLGEPPGSAARRCDGARRVERPRRLLGCAWRAGRHRRLVPAQLGV